MLTYTYLNCCKVLKLFIVEDVLYCLWFSFLPNHHTNFSESMVSWLGVLTYSIYQLFTMVISKYFSCMQSNHHGANLNHHLGYRQVDFALSAYDSLLSSSQTQAPSAICTRAGNGLSADQKSECTLQPDAALAIAEGTLHGLQECSRQLSSRRWNCSYENRGIFKHGLHKSKPRAIAQMYICIQYNTYP